MAMWIKQGVFGALEPEAAEGQRQMRKLFASKREDLYITSIREGTHSDGSFHYDGRAWDQRMNKNVTIDEMRAALGGNNFDIVLECDHVHVEYDPK